MFQWPHGWVGSPVDPVPWGSPFLPPPNPTSQLYVYTPGWCICHFLQIFVKSFPEQESSRLRSIPWESRSSGFHGNALALISVCLGTEARAGVQTGPFWAEMRRREGWIALTLPSWVGALRDGPGGMFGTQFGQMPWENVWTLLRKLQNHSLHPVPPVFSSRFSFLKHSFTCHSSAAPNLCCRSLQVLDQV